MSFIEHLKSKKAYWIVGLFVVAAGGYYWYSSSHATQAQTRYALSEVTKQTIVTTVEGTGQVSGYRQLDVKPQASGRVTAVHVKVGDKVKAGDPLVDLDQTDALKTVRDATQSLNEAKVSLDAAKLQYQKSIEPADAVSIAQAEDALAQAQRSLQTLKDEPTAYDLQQAQADVDSAAKNIKMTDDGSMPQVVRDAYDQYVVNLQSMVQVLDKSLQDANGVLGIDGPPVKLDLIRMFSILNDVPKNQAIQAYSLAKSEVADSDAEVGALGQKGEQVDKIESAANTVSKSLDQMSVLLSSVSDGLSDTLTSTDLSQSDIDSLKSSIDSDRSGINSKITALISQEQSIQQAKDSYDSSVIAYQKAVNSYNKVKAGADPSDIATAQEKVQETQAQLDKLKAGLGQLDLQIAQNTLASKQLSLVSAQNSLGDARQALADYTVRAPFDGVVATVDAQQYGDASAGSAVVTLLTTQQVATVTLNEVDVAKVQVGQKATLKFDAIDGLTITGQVDEVSPLGAANQGVVTYDVKIAFDAQDDRVKTGMSVSASIVTQVKADVLAVPNSAIKTQGNNSYVETLPDYQASSSTQGLIASNETPQRIFVTPGISNDTMTEVTDGLKEGEWIITQTVKSTTASATTQSSSALRIPGVGGATGGGARFTTGGGPRPD